MDPMDGPPQEPVNPPVAHESSAALPLPVKTVSTPVGVPVESGEHGRRTTSLLTMVVRFFRAGERSEPGWMSRHSSRPRWKYSEREPYVDLSPLDLTRRH